MGETKPLVKTVPATYPAAMATAQGTLRYALFASGSGSNLEAILKASAEGRIEAHPAVVVSNNPDAYALTRARRYGVPAQVVDQRSAKSRKDHEARILKTIEPYSPSFVVLAGYMRLLTPHLIDAFHGACFEGLPGVLNIHPADTRAYQGAHGYEFALGLLPGSVRLEQTKITVHFVDAGMDTGPIIAQRPVAVLADDTLETLQKRGLAVEHSLYPECVDLYAKGRISLPTHETTP